MCCFVALQNNFISRADVRQLFRRRQRAQNLISIFGPRAVGNVRQRGGGMRRVRRLRCGPNPFGSDCRGRVCLTAIISLKMSIVMAVVAHVLGLKYGDIEKVVTANLLPRL